MASRRGLKPRHEGPAPRHDAFGKEQSDERTHSGSSEREGDERPHHDDQPGTRRLVQSTLNNSYNHRKYLKMRESMQDS